MILTDEEIKRYDNSYSCNRIRMSEVVAHGLSANALLRERDAEIAEMRRKIAWAESAISEWEKTAKVLNCEIAVRDRAIEFLREGQQYISPENAMLVARGQIESERAEIEGEKQ